MLKILFATLPVHYTLTLFQRSLFMLMDRKEMERVDCSRSMVRLVRPNYWTLPVMLDFKLQSSANNGFDAKV